ncbi:MAG: DUF1028 domain-containing protein [Polyangiales bacterium]
MKWLPAAERRGRGPVLTAALVFLALRPAVAEPPTAGELAARDVPATTYSIVARDPKTGEMGVAVHSHWFQIAHYTPWAKAGVGAVATQALTNKRYGADGLALLEQGLTPETAIAKLTSADAEHDRRQVAIVDAKGRAAGWTGTKCIQAAGHFVGRGFVAQANMMANRHIWPAMATAFESTEGRLAERLLAALRAAEAAGGDVRGRQSAALLVVPAEVGAGPSIDLRVEDHATPVHELGRLLNIHRAYTALGEAQSLVESGNLDAAAARMDEVTKRLPDRTELPFWYALTLHEHGQTDRALEILIPLVRNEPRWRTTLERLPAADLLDRTMLDRVLKGADGRSAKPH